MRSWIARRSSQVRSSTAVSANAMALPWSGNKIVAHPDRRHKGLKRKWGVWPPAHTQLTLPQRPAGGHHLQVRTSDARIVAEDTGLHDTSAGLPGGGHPPPRTRESPSSWPIPMLTDWSTTCWPRVFCIVAFPVRWFLRPITRRVETDGRPQASLTGHVFRLM